MFLFALLAAYVLVRVTEDASAAVRKQPPPRHEYRMAKLAARQKAGGKSVPDSAFGRYVSGLVEDAWGSAHHRRQLMADDRERRRQRAVARKVERRQIRDARRDQRREPKAEFTAEVPDEAFADTGTAPPAESPRHDPLHPSDAVELDQFAKANPVIAEKAERRARRFGGRDGALWYDAVRDLKNEREALATASDQEIPDLDRLPAESAQAPEVTDSQNHKVSESQTDGVTEPKSESWKGPDMPNTTGELTGLDRAIDYADDIDRYCTELTDPIAAAVPTGEQISATCDQAHADLQAGGVTGEALTQITHVQEQLTSAVEQLQQSLSALESAGAAGKALADELRSHLGVRDAYAATPGAGSKEFVTAE